MTPLLVIPARYASSRLPGKPLLDLCGLPMIVRTYRNVLGQAAGACILVATDDVRVKDACKRYAVPVVMTSPDHKTGTDRVAEVASSRPDYDVVVNVQGDEPCMAAGCVDTIVRATRASGRVCCGKAPLPASEAFRESVGKVVCDSDGCALYLSRSIVPFPFAGKPEAWETQVCIYGFPRAALLQFAAMPQGRLERIESIELLRWMEAGHRLQMVDVPGEREAVDVPEDVDRVREYIRAKGL